MARVLFIYPNTNSALSISPAIALLSAVLKQDGHEVQLVHLHRELGLNFEPESKPDLQRMAGLVNAADPDLVAVTATSFEYQAMNTLASFLREQGRRVPIVLGGAHATFCPGDYLSSSFDAFCVGEGERAIVEVCRRIDAGCRNGELFEALPSWLASSVYPGRMPDPIPLFDRVEDLDALPAMDRELFDMDRITQSRSGWVDVFTARGCPFPCAFCCNHVFQRIYRRSKGQALGYRQRSVAQVVSEIKDLRARYGGMLRVVSFQEDFLDYDREWMLRFCETYGAEIRLPFYMCSRPEWVDETMAKSLAGAGCREISLGIESGSAFIRNHVLRKGIPDDSIYRACRCLRDVGIRVFANIMLGAPHETRHTIQETVELLARVRPDLVRPTVLVPLRGTDLYEYCRERGLLRGEPNRAGSLFDESVIQLEEIAPLELLRYRYLLGWRINAAMDTPASDRYKSLVEETERAPLESWRDQQFLRWFVGVDERLSTETTENQVQHYRLFMGARELAQLGHVKRFELWRPTPG